MSGALDSLASMRLLLVDRVPGYSSTCGAIPSSDVLTISFLTVFVYSFYVVSMLNLLC
jgi:hypothetical protein